MGHSPTSIPGRVERGEAADVVIVANPTFDELIKTGKIVPGSRVELVRSKIGMVVRAGAPKPDISSVDAFKKALLNAKSIAIIDPASGGASGVYLAQALEKLGIAELKPKTQLVSPPAGQGTAGVGEVVARGEAEIGLQPISQLMVVQGIDIVGPLPGELQSPDLSFMAASPAVSEQPLAAKALIDFLAAPEAKSVYRAKGMEPA